MMKINLKQIYKNFYYVLSSNLLSLVVSILVVIVIPKVIGVEEYGYWQLFTFYASYFGVLSFGWWDGIYLKYGGEKFNSLESDEIKSLKVQFTQICSLGLLIALTIFIIGTQYRTLDEKVIFFFLAINFPLYIIQNFLRSIFQATNVLKKYASSVVLSNIIYVVGIVLSIVFGLIDYKIILISYSIGNLASALLLIKHSRGIVFEKDIQLREYFNFKSSFQNIRSGISILVANLAGMLIIGVVRMGIKQGWNVATFGKISLTLSISNFAMLFIGAISLVAYPVLRNISKIQIKKFYTQIHSLLMITLFSMILIYFPLYMILPLWLPKYKESLTYMAILFPILVYQGKFELLTNTLFKVFRYEKKLFAINVVTVFFSMLFTSISVFFFHNLSLTIFSLIIVFQIRSLLGEIFLGMINFKIIAKDIFTEMLIILIFIASSWYLNVYLAMLIYVLSLVLFGIVFYNDLKGSLEFLRKQH